MTIRGYTGNKFDCLCQISSVYASDTASFSLTTVIYVILLQLACWPPSCAQGRSRSGTHTVPRFCWALGDEFAVVQLYWHKTLEMMYQYKAKFVGKQLALKSVCKQYRCPPGDEFLGLDLSCIENQLSIHVLP